MVVLKVAFLYIIVLSIASTCNKRQIDIDLGDGFALLDSERVIAYCNSRKGETCKKGTTILPVNSKYKNNSKLTEEYVESAKSNNKFIIARTLNLKAIKKNWWIISKELNIKDCNRMNCDSVIQSYVTGPLQYAEFQSKLAELNIELDFSKN